MEGKTVEERVTQMEGQLKKLTNQHSRLMLTVHGFLQRFNAFERIMEAGFRQIERRMKELERK